MKKEEINIIENYLCDKDVIKISDLMDYIMETFPNKKLNQKNFYLMNLYKSGSIYRYNAELVKNSCNRKKINFSINEELMKILSNINPSIDISCWDTSILSTMMSLQLMKNFTIIEAPAYALDKVMEVLLSNKKAVFIEKDYKIAKKYSDYSEIYILRTLYEEAPYNKRGFSNAIKYPRYEYKSFVTTPKIEKIMIDIFKDELFNEIISSEIYHIYYNLLSNYQINVSTLFRYARKKHTLEKLKFFLEVISFDIETGEFI